MTTASSTAPRARGSARTSRRCSPTCAARCSKRRPLPVADPLEVRVPDIGDFADVPIIEVMVSPGDTVAEEDPLVTLESDKATMDVPSPAAGTVGELKVSVGDTVSEGTVILTLEGAAGDGAAGDGAGGAAEERVVPEATAEPAGDGGAGASETVAVHVPDIGDFSDVPVIEVMVHPGDTVAEEDPLITLESDKATMDVPSPTAGKVAELKVSVGDTVSEGTLILTLEGVGAGGNGAGPSGDEGGGRPLPSVPAPPVEGTADHHADVVVLGAGPGGYTAAFRAADLGLKVILIERYERLGGVCLNVGCIPSKALLHVARMIAEAEEAKGQGIAFGEPEIDLDGLRSWKDSVVARLTGGLDGLAKQRKVDVVRGTPKFTSPNVLRVAAAASARRRTSGAARAPAAGRRSRSTGASSPRDRARSACPARRTTRASSTRPAPSSSRTSRTGC